MNIEPRNLDRRNFDDLQELRLGNYIYALRDPRDNKIFYIGQATQKNRLFKHFNEAEKYLKGSDIQPSPKILRIIEIWADEEDVDWFILSYGLTNTTNVLNAVESASIDLLSICQNGPALNRVAGPNSTLLTKEMITEIGAENVNPNNEYETVFIFPIQNRLADRISTYEATRRAWYVREDFRNRENSIAVGLSNYISKGVYLIDNWHPYDNKFEFDKNDNYDNGELLNKNWLNVLSQSFGYWQRGNYLIIQFNGQGQFRFLRGNPDKETWFNLDE